jgi:hypothetical protein
VVSFAQTPQRPKISEIYVAQGYFEAIVNDTHYVGLARLAHDPPNGKAAERLDFPTHHDYNEQNVERYDLGKDYKVQDAVCTTTDLTGNMSDEWTWLALAEYKGKIPLRGRSLDLWEATIGYATLSVGVEEYEPNTPAVLRRVSQQRTLNFEFTDFRVMSDPELYYPPRECNGTQAFTPLKNVGCLARATIIANAQVWVTDHIPYSQTTTHDGYREDCSGYVSMAWESAKPGHTTFTMNEIAHPITKDELAEGDILLCAAEHVVLFGGWTSSAKTEYVAYEETRPGEGTVKRDTPYPYWYNTACFLPYRYNSVC